ncbi:MAG: bifunctional diaminohydroxyphosphoribosylaminopyrimidine deaminase/5-amino-6-(5-phosphoribosylamino)uracil reductase RibD [Candidatus Omnitrophota bacterium]|nr:bifunctional diaminohydroxyphosphoribosylaminopyrimidine deaminase/5-amino-6-(5-phosphoribosylamino)uracil reductase RibD [Candidatus Omnitrophota bacterium]
MQTIHAHERYMRLALRLARQAQGHTSPNPMVGALVVRDGRVVGQGHHRRAGAPHAEVEALRQAGARARGATLYVTLEPCNHTGRTPPCCDAIIAAGISRVVVAAEDPNPITDGRGIARLRRKGIQVVRGVLESEAEALNEPFRKAMQTGLPFVMAKIGQSLDGKIAVAGGQSRWITSEASRRLAHRWRSRVDAILVGINTILQDDPLLTARAGTPRPARPVKVIVDSRLRTPTTARCLSAQSPAPTLIATAGRHPARAAALARRGAEVLVLPPRQGRVPLRRLCRSLARRGIHSLLIEGGGEVLASALAERLVDRVVFFIAPLLIGGRATPGAIGGDGAGRLTQAIRLEDAVSRRVGPDWCIEGRVRYPRPHTLHLVPHT